MDDSLETLAEKIALMRVKLLDLSKENRLLHKELAEKQSELAAKEETIESLNRKLEIAAETVDAEVSKLEEFASLFSDKTTP